MDWPGAAAPFPGWPFGQNSSDVTRYLMRNSIRYVIFDYRYALQNDAGICQDLKGPYRFSEWLREQLWMNVLTDKQLNQLMIHYQTIYNDGNIAVIDLAQPGRISTVGNPAWTIGTDVDTVCSQITERYLTDHPKRSDMGKRSSSKASSLESSAGL